VTGTGVARAMTPRIVAWAGHGFGVLIFVQNLLLQAGAPSFDAPAAEISAHYAEHAARLTVAVSLAPVSLLLLLAFVIGTTSWTPAPTPAAMAWGRLGIAGAVLTAAMFAVAASLQIGMLALAGPGTDTSLVRALWVLHAATVALTPTFLAALLLGASRAVHAGGSAPWWSTATATAGAAAFVLAAILAGAAAHGGPAALVGLLGVAALVLWMVTTANHLSRASRRGGPERRHASPGRISSVS